MGPKTLEIEVLACRNLLKVSRFGRLEPYVVVKYGANTNRTKAAREGGQNPDFGETFSCPVLDGLNQAELIVMSHHSANVEMVLGEVRLDLMPVLEQGIIHSTFPVLSPSGKEEGIMELKLRCPQVIAAMGARREQEEARIARAWTKYKEDSAVLKTKHVTEAHRTLAPHLAVTSALERDLIARAAVVLSESEAERGQVLGDARARLEQLGDGLVGALRGLSEQFVTKLLTELEQRAPSTKPKFEAERAALIKVVNEANADRTKELRAAEKDLLAALAEVGAKYGAAASQAERRFEKCFQAGAEAYRRELERRVLREAKAKAAEAAGPAPPMPTSQTCLDDKKRHHSGRSEGSSATSGQSEGSPMHWSQGGHDDLVEHLRNGAEEEHGENGPMLRNREEDRKAEKKGFIRGVLGRSGPSSRTQHAES